MEKYIICKLPVYVLLFSDINECEIGEHNCQAPKEECINTQGSFRCKILPNCTEGFRRDPNSLKCVGK